MTETVTRSGKQGGQASLRLSYGVHLSDRGQNPLSTWRTRKVKVGMAHSTVAPPSVIHWNVWNTEEGLESFDRTVW